MKNDQLAGFLEKRGKGQEALGVWVDGLDLWCFDSMGNLGLLLKRIEALVDRGGAELVAGDLELDQAGLLVQRRSEHSVGGGAGAHGDDRRRP